MVPAAMTAVVLSKFGGPDVLDVARLPVPEPEPGQVLVRVRAVSVGRTLDVATRAGWPPFARLVRFPHLFGADHVGEVVAAGADVPAVATGRRVAVFPVLTCGRCAACARGHQEQCAGMELLGVHRPGAYAQYCAVPATNVVPVPDGIPDREASALALNGAVAHRQLEVLGLAPGDWLLLPAAGGALGSAVLATAVWRGIRVIAGTRQAWKQARLEALGAELVVDTAAPDFPDQVLAATDGLGVHAVIDNVVDIPTWHHLDRILVPGGTVVCSGAIGAARVEVDLRTTYLRSQSIRTVRTARPSDVLATWQEVANGLRVPVDDEQFELTKAAAAHRHLESDSSFGRVVLTVE